MVASKDILGDLLKAAEELVVRMDYEMLMEVVGPNKQILISLVPPRGSSKYEGRGRSFSVALNRALFALQDDVMNVEDTQGVLRILDRSGLL